ncbi:MAG TPA: carbonate dehydratase [Vicinamibacterales bacterium]|jgi:carbonic anhydrase
MSETERIARGLTERTLPKAEWTHHAHLRAGLWHVWHHGDEALALLRDRISRYNESVGTANTDTSGYHETITRLYVTVIAAFLAGVDRALPLDALAERLIAEHGDPGLPLRHYSKRLLFSAAARRGWVEPDRVRITVMTPVNALLENNRRWAADRVQRDPSFFTRLAKQQAPEFLWIGCSDSRVPANEIVGLDPGELFVHRNVANVVVHTDLNCLSVLQFAVDVLKVKHVIVCGHYGCGGIRAAIEKETHGLIDNWLRHVQDVERDYQHELDGIADSQERVDRLCELNVAEQVRNISRTTIVQDAWRRGHNVQLHGWVYGLKDGIITDLHVSI